MRIEKLNDNQIRCILNKKELESRNINADELTYGSDKANTLFKEMTQQANRQFGFQIDNTPVMVEAIPLEDESIAIIITKVEEPEELDTRFSKFTPCQEDEDYEDGSNYKEKLTKANELLGFLNSFREALAENPDMNFAPLSALKDNTDKKEDSDSRHSASNTSMQTQPKANNHTRASDTKKTSDTNRITLVFQFDNIDRLIKLSHVLKTKYNDVNSLYRNGNNYYLAMQKGAHSPEEFNQVCNIICEFGSKISLVHISEAHMKEHFECILKERALQDLLKI